MAFRYDAVRLLEPREPIADLGRGFAAEVADPAWMLGRQWQLGEHQGEDASSPVRIAYRASLDPIESPGGSGLVDPRLTPAEAIVESEPGEWWTPGRRVAIRRRVEQAARAAGRPIRDDPAVRLAGLPVPYDVLDGTGYDGRALYEQRTGRGLDLAWFGETPPEPPPPNLWDPADLTYNADFPVAGTSLRLRRHDGGELDWFSVDALAAIPPPATLPEPQLVYPTRVRYPGSPNPRWWQIEDATVDIGGYPPDRSHFATLLLIELVTSHSDDWFTFPVTAKTGHVVTLHEVVVHDSFGKTWRVEPPVDGWSLFSVTGLDRRSLVLWPTVATPLVGPVLDEVLLGVDEDANLLWAVERRLAGRDIPTPERPGSRPSEGQVDASAPPRYVYRPTGDIPQRWHPYRIEKIEGRRRFVQCRLADLTGGSPALAPEPVSDLLYERPLAADIAQRHPVHQIEPATVPPDGLLLERRFVLARRTDGRPVLWTQRRRVPLSSPPGHILHFDVFEAVATTAQGA